MTESGLTWATVAEGFSASVSFAISAEEMDAFATLSGDRSLIHTDEAEARAQGFTSVVVYGGLMTAKLSGLLGSLLPGPLGLSNTWSIHFHHPLYVGEPAVLSATLEHLSPAARVLMLKFAIRRGDTLIANGKVQTMLLEHRTGPGPDPA